MAFFDQIGKRLSDVSQNVSQQTKNFTDTTRLNAEISEKRRKLPGIYEAVGRAYYERHKNDLNAEERDKIQEINTTFAEIARLEEEIRQIRGITKCPVCGTDNANDAVFCSACGNRIDKISSPVTAVEINERRCPNCNAIAKKDNLFCNYCGTRLPAAESGVRSDSEESEGEQEALTDRSNHSDPSGLSATDQE